MAMPSTVLISTRASAPASSAAPATSTMSGVFGLNFTHSGNRHAAAAVTACAVARAEWANMRPRSSRLGQLTFTSTAMTPGAPSSIAAASAYS